MASHLKMPLKIWLKSHRQSFIKVLFREIKMLQEESDGEESSPELWCGLDKTMILHVVLVDVSVLHHVPVILGETVANEFVVFRHLVYNWAETRDAGRDNFSVVLKYQLDGVLFQLSEEDFARMFD